MYTLADLNKRKSFAGKPRFGFQLKFKVKKHLYFKTNNLCINPYSPNVENMVSS
jgi:hypothetical protein